MKTTELKQFVRSGGYAWPGGYPTYALCADGEVLDVRSVCENYKQILYATRYPNTNEMWRIVAIDVHWEGEPLYCANSNRPIESAYGVPE